MHFIKHIIFLMISNVIQEYTRPVSNLLVRIMQRLISLGAFSSRIFVLYCVKIIKFTIYTINIKFFFFHHVVSLFSIDKYNINENDIQMSMFKVDQMSISTFR